LRRRELPVEFVWPSEVTCVQPLDAIALAEL
jgi:hypothetical protein